MASPPILDIDKLLAPIDGANPAGSKLPHEVKEKLDEARKEVNLNQFDAKDPRRPEQPQQADWPGIIEIAQDALTQISKDLLVAARMTEALVKVHRFAGLRDGLRLLRRITVECWDRLYPVSLPEVEESDDPEAAARAAAEAAQIETNEARAAVFNWLDDELKGARFPFTIRTVPLTRVGKAPEFSAQYGWQQWKDAQTTDDPKKPKGAVSAEAFDQAVVATPREYCQSTVDDLVECVTEVNGLYEALGTKMGEAAPGLAQMRKAVLECQEVATFVLKRKGPAPLASAAATPAQEADGAAEPTPVELAARRPLTREDLLNRLADASALLLQMEPHSPIAYMIQRAVKMARLPLPDLMKVLIREPSVLSQLDRDLDLGLDRQDAAKTAKNK